MNRKRSYTNPYNFGSRSKKIRAATAKSNMLVAKKRSYVRRAPTLGYTRITGNFGRFQPSSISGEKKFLDIVDAVASVPAAGLILPTNAATCTPAVAMVGGSFNQIAQGDQEYQRVGKEVVVTSVMVRGQVILPGGNTTYSDTVRFLIVQDTQCNGAVATVNNVLGFTGSTPSINSFNNIENSRRFLILSDTRYDVTAFTSNGATIANNRTVDFEIYKKCNIPIVFDTTATSGSLATVRSNNIFGIVIDSSAVDDMTCRYTMRLRYQDR